MLPRFLFLLYMNGRRGGIGEAVLLLLPLTVGLGLGLGKNPTIATIIAPMTVWRHKTMSSHDPTRTVPTGTSLTTFMWMQARHAILQKDLRQPDTVVKTKSTSRPSEAVCEVMHTHFRENESETHSKLCLIHESRGIHGCLYSN